MTTKEKIKLVIQLEHDRQALSDSLKLLKDAYKYIVSNPKEKAKIAELYKKKDAIEAELKRILPPDQISSNF